LVEQPCKLHPINKPINNMYKIVNFITKELVLPNGLVFIGEDGQQLEVVIKLDKIVEKLNLHYFKISPPGLAKYLPIMPIEKVNEFISLQEAATPLLRSRYLGERLGIDLYFKLEGKNPTGSFKDRGSAVEVAIAKEMGASAIILASTGNMAASCACYAAVANIPCFVLVPEGIPISKVAQVIAFGAKVVRVKGDYNDAATLAENIAKEMGFYLAGDYAFRIEGQKTAAFEISDQMLFQPPDILFVPIGCGTNIAAYAKGFDEYQKLGLIDQKPRLYGVQAEGAAAVVNSYVHDRTDIIPLAQVDTIASAISVPNPIDGIKALHAIRSTNGGATSVTDQEILEAQQLLSRKEGLFVESASASTVAALLKNDLVKEGIKSKKVVCVLTGDGLKDAAVVLKAAMEPHTIYPETQEFIKLLKNNSI
jgi:threonine synthase